MLIGDGTPRPAGHDAPAVMRARLERLVTLVVVAVILSAPLVCNDFWLNRLARCLVFGMLGVAMALSWRCAGIPNPGQGLFFGLGAYMTAMSLKLAAAASRQAGAATPVPDFMRWHAPPDAPTQLCCITRGAFLWLPFQSQWLALALSLAVPAVVAAAIGRVLLRRRVPGVVIGLILLAAMLLVRQAVVDAPSLTNGVNGLSDLSSLTLGGIAFWPYDIATYYLVATALAVVFLGARRLAAAGARRMRLTTGHVSDRAGTPGTDAAAYRALCLVVSAAICGLAGALYVTVAQFAAPSLMGAGLAITMVLWAVIGGRTSLPGACVGAILIGLVDAKVRQAESLVLPWRAVLGLIGLVSLLALPRGLAGLVADAADRVGVAIALRRRPARQVAVRGESASPRQ